MKKLMIVPWWGPLPEWVDRWRENTAWVTAQGHGWDFLLETDEVSIRSRVESLGVACPNLEGRKLCDFKPALGEMYANEVADYDFWGHTDLDCVYGPLWDYVTDELLADCDVFANDPAPHMCGPFSLYRTATASHVFRQHSQWRKIMESDEYLALDEPGMTKTIAQSGLTSCHAFWHGPDSMYVHFRRPKIYPDLPTSFFEPKVAA